MLRVNDDDGTIEHYDPCEKEWVRYWPPAAGSDPDLGATMRQAIDNLVSQKVGGMLDTRPDPVAGECRSYDLYLSGSNQLLSPIQVDAGDLITIDNVRGTWAQDGGDGVVFRFTYPYGIGYTQGEDPLPAVDHMRFIMNINGVWYDAYNITDFEVPAGVLSTHIVFQANDDEIQDNKGGISFALKICKAESLPYEWDHVFDWELGAPQGPFTNYGGTGFVYGTGFVGGITDNGFYLPTPDTDTIVKYIEQWFSEGLLNGSQTDHAIYGETTTVRLTPDKEDIPGGPGGNHFIYNLADNIHYSNINFYWHAPGGSVPPNGTTSKVRVKGVGPDPFAD